ncbi:MBL fold metallo-hydrolase [Sphingobacterium hungaricum]
MSRNLKRTMYIILSLVVILFVVYYFFTRQEQMGQVPSGLRLERMSGTATYKNGAFDNLSVTPAISEDENYFNLLKNFLFGKEKRNEPTDEIPHIQTDLHSLPLDSNLLVWFGHSSYYLQLDGKRFLIDPVFSGAASPLPGSVKAFAGANTYGVDDMPEIDYLVISHDHWDHLDYKTILGLKNKVKQVITGLGVGSHFELWGYDPKVITELYWHESADLSPSFKITATPARHFSGRLLTRNNTLWASYVLQTPTAKLFLGGDSGYDTHFKQIGEQYGPFDLAILENGQYNKSWKYIHMMPEEVVQASQDLNATKFFPVHSSKFSLALHPWDEPLIRVSKEANLKQVPLITPKIGEVVYLNQNQLFEQWWVGKN